jgi:hypothetical protein
VLLKVSIQSSALGEGDCKLQARLLSGENTLANSAKFDLHCVDSNSRKGSGG